MSRADLAAQLTEGAVTVLDLRPAGEYAAAHIPGVLNATLADLDGMLHRLDLHTEIVACCRGLDCIHAHQAVAALRARGLNARRMDGGLPEWREDGLVVETIG